MASKAPNFDSMKVIELKAYLRDNFANVSLTGTKQKLIEKAKHHFQTSNGPSTSSSSENQMVVQNVNCVSDELKLLEQKRKVFDANVEYQDLSKLPEGIISESFNSTEIYKYLKDWKLFVDKEEVDIGTDKQFIKGLQMYDDKLIQLVEYSELNVPDDATKDLLMFRAEINASMCQEVQ